ncbi:MAG: hypothetical protein DMF38_05260 [Verrucomicrobia bacterium]|nr:MAG: hypothetical protein DMF38_05260 [Verrucomicrobiota bacterium]
MKVIKVSAAEIVFTPAHSNREWREKRGQKCTGQNPFFAFVSREMGVGGIGEFACTCYAELLCRAAINAVLRRNR